MSIVGGVPGFVVRPPHLAFCTLIRILTSDSAGQTFQPDATLASNLAVFIIIQVSKNDLHFPSLSGILSQLEEELGEDGVAFGNFCKETLSGLNTVASLTRFFDSMKGDFEGKSGTPNIQRRILPQDRPYKCGKHGVFGIFARKCIVNFEEMSFEQIANLTDEVDEYCTGVLDKGSQSVYLNDYDKLEAHVDDLLEQAQRGQIPESLEQDLESLEPVMEIFPKPTLVKHEVAVLRREVTTAFDFLRQYYNRSMHSGPGFTISENPSTDRPANNIHSLMLKMASTHFHFEHIEKSMKLLEEAFESANACNDETALQSCLVVQLQNLIQTSPSILHSAKLPVGKKERFEFIYQSLRRCEQKAIEMKTPHILAFCQICRSTLGVKNHLINNRLASSDEICRLTGNSFQVLTRLRSFVSAGSVASSLKTHTNDENTPGVLPSLFDSASEIFGPSVKGNIGATETTVQQSLASGLLLNSLAWKAKGFVGLSGVLALSVEVVHSSHCKVSDRAAALAHLAIMAANSKGPVQGQNILDYAKQVPRLADEISIKMADEYIRLGQHLWTAPSGPVWDEIQERIEALVSISNHSAVTCLKDLLMGEIQATRAMLTLNQTDEATEAVNRLVQVQDESSMEEFRVEIELLDLDLQEQLGVFNLKMTKHLEELTETQSNPTAIVLFCRTLLKLEDKSHEVISELLKSVYPRVLAEGSIVFEAAFLLFVIDFMLRAPGLSSSRNKIEVLVSLIKHGVDLSTTLKNLYFLKEFFKKNEQLQKKYSDQQLKDETFSELVSICRRNGMTRAQIPSLSNRGDRDDLMEVD